MAVLVSGLYHAQVVHVAIAIQVEVRECRVRVVNHLLKLLQVLGLSKEGSHGLEVKIFRNISVGSCYSHCLVGFRH
jgi:hypothetical protein